MRNNVFLIDGHALIFRMYYALLSRPMINSKGVDTSILYGFTKYLFELINNEKPTHLAVVFDPPGGSFRNKIYPDYKANRPETPELIKSSREPLSQICSALGIPTIMKMGFEADDVIGSLAKKFGKDDTYVYMVTPDKDYGQLIDNNIFQYKPAKAQTEAEIYNIEKICDKYGINRPTQIIDLLTLCGDIADNVKGVMGIGEKIASKLIDKYDSIENIYDNLNDLSAKQKEKFKLALPYIYQSKELITIKTDIDCNISLDDMKISNFDNPKIIELFDEYEFSSLKKYVNATKINKTVEVTLVETPYNQLINHAYQTKKVAIDIDNKDITALCIVDDKGYYCKSTIENFSKVLEDESINKIGIFFKNHIKTLINNNKSLKGKIYDIDLISYLINPEQSNKLESLAKSKLGIDIYQDIDNENINLFETKSSSNTNLQLYCCYKLADILFAELDSPRQNIYWTMEEPLMWVLANMEITGVKFDLQCLKSYAKNLQKELDVIEEKIRNIANNQSLNISSPKQIGQLIFEELKLDPYAKKSSKGNWTTDEATLSALRDRHEVVGDILEYRGIKKLLSTYIDPFETYIDSTGKIHTTFNQSLTSTGRLSSSNPNLQNIPIRTERGKEIRKAFVSSFDGGYVISADYSQIELRIMAHLSQDEHLISAFRHNIDIHTATASKIFGIDPQEVTSDQRRIAKTANFGIMYGISAFGLSQRLSCSPKEAKQIIDDYFIAFPAIKTYISKTLEQAKKDGYVSTIFGRRRYIPELSSANKITQALGERNAINAPIQGSSADIIKLAMIRVADKLKGYKSQLVLQIHDELLIDVYPPEIEEIRQIIIQEMENVITLSIPLSVECSYGKNWLEAH